MTIIWLLQFNDAHTHIRRIHKIGELIIKIRGAENRKPNISVEEILDRHTDQTFSIVSFHRVPYFLRAAKQRNFTTIYSLSGCVSRLSCSFSLTPSLYAIFVSLFNLVPGEHLLCIYSDSKTQSFFGPKINRFTTPSRISLISIGYCTKAAESLFDRLYFNRYCELINHNSTSTYRMGVELEEVLWLWRSISYNFSRNGNCSTTSLNHFRR